MMNQPLRCTHEHATALSRAIDEGLERVRGDLRELGYSENVIALEVGLQLARRANEYLDHESIAHPQPVNGHGNGVNKP